MSRDNPYNLKRPVQRQFSRKATFGIQCRLQQNNRVLVSWIPEEYAVKGKTLNLLDRDTKKWENGWIVLDTGAKKPYDFIIQDSQDYKAWREVTDI